ncbi:sterol acyltransferase Ecym_2101 [Eremothecium cymbalariae DBVPG|uniref:O-acyltransferase n=1 Tax=Eremothecium cymbalariae (strain CBS 270.75 / DBVPG 7215 / KCTC 17166 / NRRL Y-17582) TaxID=931890 RepID=G8JPK5_ERECY|nr:Hypothetical protein Ecym_2101 [Eremothecium cymbalariae DBVPG\
MAQQIVKDKNYLRIKQLNEGSKRNRRSLPQYQIRDLREKENCGEGCEQTVVIRAEVEVPLDRKTQGVLGERGHSGPLKDYANTLQRKERMRFRADSGEMQSLLRDVKFGHRGTIMDDFVNYPLRIYFGGPRLEKADDCYHRKGALADSLASFGVDKQQQQQQQQQQQARSLENISISIDEQVTIQRHSVNFSGFYVLFWLAVSFVLFKVTVGYYNENNGNILQSPIVQFMTTDLFRVARFDFLMYLSTYVVFLVQWMCKMEFITWGRVGWVVTSMYELAFFVYFTYLAEHTMKFKWISKIFLFLHCCVLVMKMHSYAFYNGYLWQSLAELRFSQKSLAILKKEDEEVDPVVLKTLEKSESFCKFELSSQSASTPFPSNITLSNYFTFTMFPILIYQIEYPRTKTIRWGYVCEKVTAIFGIIFIMMVISQLLIYPVAIEALSMRESGIPLLERAQKWPQLLLDLVPAFIVMYLLVWYLIWEAILSCIAELTRFGDRFFYGDWWNCVDWGEYSRLWNVPVHKFLLRHVYHSSLSAFYMSKTQATLITFILSALVHELAMYVIFGRLRFYLFLLQMAQIPLMAVNNSKLLRNKRILRNVIFWFGICTAPSLVCTIYLTL